MAEPEYLTTHEVAQHYRTADATVRYWRHIGYGPRGAKIGRRVLYPRAEIERFDQEQRAATESSAEARTACS
jgi:hypothetical protein